MHNNKRNIMVKKILLILLILSAGFNIVSPLSSAYAQEDRDSLFNRLISELTHHSAQGSAHINLPDNGGSSEDNGNAADIKCSFAARAAARINYNRFTPSQKIVIDKILSRPVLQKSVVSPSGYFRIHYDETGINTPAYVSGLSPEQNAMLVAEAFDSSYNFEVKYLGFDPPPGDGLAGGDNKYDVYLENYPEYGTTSGEDEVTPGHYASYIQMDNDYAGTFNTHGIKAALVTAAHEFHHAIQLGSYSFAEKDRYFYEMTSTSMEEFVYSDINDYFYYLNKYFNNPNKSIANYDGYAIAIWNIFLQKRFGYGIFKRQWDLYLQMSVLSAINQSLLEVNSSLKDALNEFGVWTYFTGYRSNTQLYFPEGNKYPLLKRLISPLFNQQNNMTMQPVSNNFLLFYNIRSGGFTDTIVAVITNTDIPSADVNPSGQINFSYGMYDHKTNDSKPVGGGYFSVLNASNIMFFNESAIVNDSINHPDFNLDLSFAFPNPFRYSRGSSVSDLFIPVDFNRSSTADLNIYSSGMELVYSSQSRVVPYAGKVFVKWNGLDNNGQKLPSGVYIYVTNSDDKIFKGKIVIINEK